MIFSVDSLARSSAAKLARFAPVVQTVAVVALVAERVAKGAGFRVEVVEFVAAAVRSTGLSVKPGLQAVQKVGLPKHSMQREVSQFRHVELPDKYWPEGHGVHDTSLLGWTAWMYPGRQVLHLDGFWQP